MDRNCGNCVFYRPPVKSHDCGQCDYPVPEWLKIGASGGGYISSAEYEGTNCTTFKSRADVVASGKEVPAQ